MLRDKFERLTKTYGAQSGVSVCLISLVALTEETAAAQRKLDETAAAQRKLDEQAAATEVTVLKSHLAQMSSQLVRDGAVLGMSQAGLLASLLVMFDVTEEGLLDHPQFRDIHNLYFVSKAPYPVSIFRQIVPISRRRFRAKFDLAPNISIYFD